MRADSPGGRIMGALARDPAVETPADGAPGLPGWIEHETRALPGRPRRLQRSSLLGRIVAALARTDTALSRAPFTPALQEAPTGDADLTILVAGQRPASRATRPTRSSVAFYPYEPVAPTSAARLGITTVPV